MPSPGGATNTRSIESVVSSGLDTYARVRHRRVVVTVAHSDYYTGPSPAGTVASNKSGPALPGRIETSAFRRLARHQAPHCRGR
jgi:hypothetical protein